MRIESFAQPTAEQSHRELTKKATEFESILLTEWLGKMQETFAGTEPESDAAGGTLSSLGTQSLAQGLAARNVLGVGRMLVHALESTAGTNVTGGAVIRGANEADKKNASG